MTIEQSKRISSPPADRPFHRPINFRRSAHPSNLLAKRERRGNPRHLRSWLSLPRKRVNRPWGDDDSWFVRTSPAVSHRMLRLMNRRQTPHLQCYSPSPTPLPFLTQCGTPSLTDASWACERSPKFPPSPPDTPPVPIHNTYRVDRWT